MLERRQNLSHAEFQRDYFLTNRPVILQGILEDWPARRLWTPDYLKARCGHQPVEIMGGRDRDPNYEINCDRHRQNIPFADYVDQVMTGSGNDNYLVANNRFFDSPVGRVLLDDIVPFPEYLNPHDVQGRLFFWFGPAGTVTPLHYDTPNIFLAQVIGHKRMCFFGPDQTPLLYNKVGVFSAVDYERPDIRAFPLFGFAQSVEFTLLEGEVLFIPANWWHWVRSLTASLSISFTNFR